MFCAEGSMLDTQNEGGAIWVKVILWDVLVVDYVAEKAATAFALYEIWKTFKIYFKSKQHTKTG